MKAGRYEAGRTNMTRDQAKKFAKRSWIALGVAILYVILLFILNAPQVFMLLVGVPVFLAVKQAMEARSKFSVHHGLHGLYDEGEGIRHTTPHEEFQLDDKTRAHQILFFATGAGILAGLLAYVVLV